MAKLKKAPTKTEKIQISKAVFEHFADTEQGMKMMSSEAWQNPGTLVHPTSIFPSMSIGNISEKDIDKDIFTIKEKCRKAFRESPHVGSIVSNFSSWVWGDRSFIYSDYQFVQEYIDEFWKDWFNDMDVGVSEIITNLLVDGEAFPMVTILNLKGDMRISMVEDKQIRGGDKGFGIVSDPDDISVTAFYIVENDIPSVGDKIRLIPDINLLWNPELYDKLKANGTKNGFNDALTASSKWKGAGRRTIKNKTGLPFKQYIVPWKNLMGIKNQRRSVSAIRRALSSSNKYDTMLNYAMDFFKAMMSYTDVFEFDSDRAGLMAFNWIAKKMQTEKGRKELYNTGITKPKAPGDTVITRPGMKYKKVAPQIAAPPLEGWFKDFLNATAVGLNTPSDMASSDSSGSTFAALKMSRQGPDLMKNFVQWRLSQYLRTRLMRSVFKLKSALDSSFAATIPIDRYFINAATNKLEKTKVNVPLWDEGILKISMPDADLSDDDKKTKALLGSKHLGSIQELGLSRDRGAQRLGVNNYSLQARDKLFEDDLYGKQERVSDKERSSEDAIEDAADKNASED